MSGSCMNFYFRVNSIIFMNNFDSRVLFRSSLIEKNLLIDMRLNTDQSSFQFHGSLVAIESYVGVYSLTNCLHHFRSVPF